MRGAAGRVEFVAGLCHDLRSGKVDFGTDGNEDWLVLSLEDLSKRNVKVLGRKQPSHRVFLARL